MTTTRSDSAGSDLYGDVRHIARDIRMIDYPGFLMRVIETRSAELYTATSPRPDVTPRQISILLGLFQLGQTSQANLAEYLRMDRSTLGEVVRRLVEKGMVVRLRSEEDGRAHVLRTTEEGLDVLFTLLPLLIQLQQTLLAPLPAEYHAIFIKCLRILADEKPQA